MELRIYTIFDEKADHYLQPFFNVTDAAAMRLIGNMANDPNSQFGKNPEDYTIWLVGLFDQRTGQTSPIEPMIHVVKLWDLVDRSTNLEELG